MLSLDGAAAAATHREGAVAIRIDHDSADLAVGDRQFIACRRDSRCSTWEHAKLSGVDFRATGTDRDWGLEIRNGDAIGFDTSDAAYDRSVPTPEPGTDAARRMTVCSASESGEVFEVQISGVQCAAADRDDMTGAPVTVIVNERLFTGCGRPLH